MFDCELRCGVLMIGTMVFSEEFGILDGVQIMLSLRGMVVWREGGDASAQI